MCQRRACHFVTWMQNRGPAAIRQLYFTCFLDSGTRLTIQARSIQNRPLSGIAVLSGNTGAIEAGGTFARQGRVLVTAHGHVKMTSLLQRCRVWGSLVSAQRRLPIKGASRAAIYGLIFQKANLYKLKNWHIDSAWDLGHDTQFT